MSNSGTFDAILCRTNAGCLSAALECRANGQSFALLISGGIGSLRDFASAASELQNGQRVDHAELGAFPDWGEVQTYAASKEGEDLKPMVRIIDKYGVHAIFDICAASLSEKQAAQADVQIVTVHRSKGLEWDRVLIFTDFTPPVEGDLQIEDVRLAYVAVTRARLFLDAGAINWMLTGDYKLNPTGGF